MGEHIRVVHSYIGRVVRDGYTHHVGRVLGVEWWVHEIFDADSNDVIAVIITFRGTENSVGGFRKFRDWIRNFLISPYCPRRAGYQAGCGHYGYIKAAERAIRAGMAYTLEKLYGKEMPLYLAGHSKGVESAPCAEMLHNRGFNVVEWIGFGCPAMWTSNKNLPFDATNYCIPGDLIPRLQPWYDHRAEEVTLPDEIDGHGWKYLRKHDISAYIERVQYMEMHNHAIHP